MNRNTKTITIKAEVHKKVKAEADRTGMKIAPLAERLLLKGLKK